MANHWTGRIRIFFVFVWIIPYFAHSFQLAPQNEQTVNSGSAYPLISTQHASDHYGCLTEPSSNPFAPASSKESRKQRQPQNILRTYRIAVAATGEYTASCGGTVSAAHAVIRAVINQVSQIFESELGVRLQLVAGNEKIIYTAAALDPYDASDLRTIIEQNQTNLDRVIGSTNYDLGIVFTTNRLGLAYTRSVCDPPIKGKAAVGAVKETGDKLNIELVAHEIAHMFGANHTFNSVLGDCRSFRNAATAVEPGSGSTLMSYAMLHCETDRLQFTNDTYFHAINHEEVRSFIEEGTGSESFLKAELPNQLPFADAGSDYTIPKGTSFFLKARGEDPDGDVLTYCWEQMDLGDTNLLENTNDLNGPLFRSFPPTSSPVRVFPDWSRIVENGRSIGETLPEHSRLLKFRVTIRDSKRTGGIASDDAVISVDGNSGPFRVLAPNGGELTSRSETIRWDVANTAASPVAASHVNILLSTNSGQNFDLVLITDTPNDGFEQVTLPRLFAPHCRIKVEAANNIFFDISDQDFTLRPDPPLRISSFRMSENLITLEWLSVPGRRYRVQFRSGLDGTNWADQPPDIAAESEITRRTYLRQNSAGAFYRVFQLQ